MDQRSVPYGMPGDIPQHQQHTMQPGMQQHYNLQDMMFDPLPMSNSMYHQPSAVGGHMMHQQHPETRAGGMQNLGGLMVQHGVDDLDDLMNTLGDSVGFQQQQHLGQMPNHVYDQQLMPQHPQASSLQSGRTQGIPITSQAPPMQQNGMRGSMHMNQMSPNGVGVGGRMGVGIHQQPNMGTPVVSSNLGGLGISIPAPVSAVPRQAAVAQNPTGHSKAPLGEKCKRIYPDVKQLRILQKVTDDIVVVHRIASVASDMSDREFISVAFRLRDGDDYYIGLKSISVQTEAAENCTRGEECQGWMFIGGENEASQWKAHFLGYYDVKGEKDDKVLNQLANEAMFGMLRWESEAMHPTSV
ncbi:unnamed protein product [Peronospora farinosa]|uniref:Uncharacterized protein n=1 Tax=Peronospora farinosa TaxID=134698 RepID=A0ABN8C0D6_9STRA|nr:unnamed protein product [Peronospora farinosa]